MKSSKYLVARLASLLEPVKRRYVPTWGSSISRYWQRFGLATGGDEDEGEVDSEDEAAAAAAAMTGRATLGRATHLLADGGIVFEVQQE